MKTFKESRGMMAVIVMLAGLCCGLAGAQGPLGYVPDDAVAAVFLPSVADVESAGSFLMKIPAVGNAISPDRVLGDLLYQLNLGATTTYTDFLKAMGVNVNAPAAVMLLPDKKMGAVLPLASRETAEKQLTELLGTGLDPVEEGGFKGAYSVMDGVAYALSDAMAVVGSDDVTVKKIAAAGGSAKAFSYQPLNELAVLSAFDRLKTANLLPQGLPGASMETTYQQLAGIMDEMVVAAGEMGGSAYVKLGLRNPGGANIEKPAPLGLHALLPANAAVVLNLRNNANLINQIRPLVAANPALSKNMAIIMLVSQMLGNEVAIGLTGMENGVPIGLVAAHLSRPDSVKMLLGMAGVKPDTPDEVYNNASIFTIRDVKEGVNVYVATAGAYLLVSAKEDQIKGALDKLDASGAIKADAGSSYDSLANRGLNGFVRLDGSKLDASALPADLAALSQVNAEMILGINGAWYDNRLELPGGFDQVGKLVSLFVK